MAATHGVGTNLFFTYMSYRYPKLISNSAKVSFVNSMHGVRLKPGIGHVPKAALPLVALNSVTMLGAKNTAFIRRRHTEDGATRGRSPAKNYKSWRTQASLGTSQEGEIHLGSSAPKWSLDERRQASLDEALLTQVMGLPCAELAELQAAAHTLRERRIGNVTREHGDGG